MQTAAHWKMTADDLRARAERVTTPANGNESPRVSARAAAQVLAGIVSHVARTWSVEVMQQACATLARNEPTWDLSRSNVIALPLENGVVTEPVRLIGIVANGLLVLAGPDNVRAALSFWATEDDPGVWTRLIES